MAPILTVCDTSDSDGSVDTNRVGNWQCAGLCSYGSVLDKTLESITPFSSTRKNGQESEPLAECLTIQVMPEDVSICLCRFALSR